MASRGKEKDHDEENRQAKLDLVREQVAGGALMIRPMTSEERRRYPPPPTNTKGGDRR